MHVLRHSQACLVEFQLAFIAFPTKDAQLATKRPILMTYLKYARFALAIAVGLSFSSSVIAQVSDTYTWNKTGTDDWNNTANWDGSFVGVPEAQFNDVAVIGNGGTAQVTNNPNNASTINVNNGVLDIRAAGNLTTTVGADGLSTGNVSVGANGTLNVAGGGLLTVNANLNLGGTFSPELTASPQNPVGVTGTASLGGDLVANVNGATTASGTTWNLIDAMTVTGNFASVSNTGTALPMGQVFGVNQVSGGNGTIVQLEVEQRLVLNLDRDTGIVSIENVAGASGGLEFDSYLIQSAVGSINPVSWSSLEDQGIQAPGNPWFEAGSGGSTMNSLAEFNPTASETLAPGTDHALGSIYAPNFAGVPFGGETEDHTFTYTNNGETFQGVVNYVGDKQQHNIVLTVNPTTGEAALQNESGAAIAIDSYSIASEGGGLLTTWDSLEDQGGPGGTWLEANPTANRLSELTEEGSTLLNQNEGFNLSTLFNTGSAQDLTFEFIVADTTTVLDGIVVYGDLPTNIITPGSGIPGDFDMDGDVDIVDFGTFGQNFGLTGLPLSPPTDGDFEPDGDVDIVDFGTFAQNFGTGTGSGSAIPEPAAGVLALMAILATLQSGRRT